MEDTLIEPHQEFFIGTVAERSVTSQDRYVGNPRCRWTYPGRLLTGEQFYQLKKFVGNAASANVIVDVITQTINTTTYEPLVATYSAIMHWPERDVIVENYNRWSFPDEGILFTNLEPI